MLRCEIPVVTPADNVLFEGLPILQPILDHLGPGAVLVGGLACAAWLTSRPISRLPVRATRDVDLGIDQPALGIRGDRVVLRPLLTEMGFVPGFAGEDFRFSREVEGAPFVVDLLVAKGSSRRTPPLAEAGMPSLAAPGLRYALDRGPVPLRLVLERRGETRELIALTISLDAAFVMKATLVADAVRLRPDKRVTDTADAVMLAAACADDPDTMAALARNRRRSEARRALRWLAQSFEAPTSLAARRVGTYSGSPEGGALAVEIVQRFKAALDAAVRQA